MTTQPTTDAFEARFAALTAAAERVRAEYGPLPLTFLRADLPRLTAAVRRAVEPVPGESEEFADDPDLYVAWFADTHLGLVSEAGYLIDEPVTTPDCPTPLLPALTPCHLVSDEGDYLILEDDARTVQFPWVVADEPNFAHRIW